MPPPLPVAFIAGATGTWTIDSVTTVSGAGLPAADRLAMVEGVPPQAGAEAWRLAGVTSNTRYTTHAEAAVLAAVQQELGRPEATRAALIPIRKSAAWWALAQDERRVLMQDTSRHIDIGLEYLPAVARRLHHCRDLGGPFDFLTWFEYAPDHSDAFERMTARLRQTAEWQYVEREVDVRLRREPRPLPSAG